MDDLASRLNPRTEEEGLKIEAEENAKKAAQSAEESPVAEDETEPTPSKADDDLAVAASGLNIEQKKTDESEKKDESSESKKEEAPEEEQSNLINSTYEVKVKLADLQADPNSPLYSVKAFEELGLYEKLQQLFGLMNANMIDHPSS